MKTTRNKNEWWCRKVITGKYSAICKINFNNKRETLQVETAPHIPYHNFVTTKVPVHTWAREFDANASFSIFENKKAKVQGIWGKVNRNSAAPFTEQNGKRGPFPTQCMQEQVANGSVKNVFHTDTLIKPVQNCVRTCQYYKYSSTTGSNSTLVSKIVCMHTYWKLFSMNSEGREARTLPGV